MTIGEMAEASGVSARSIRHYEKEGLLASKRMPNGYRDFDSEGITVVRQIGLLLQLGFSIRATRELAPCFPETIEAIAVCPRIRAALVNHRAKLKARHADLGRLLRRIDVIVAASPR